MLVSAFGRSWAQGSIFETWKAFPFEKTCWKLVLAYLLLMISRPTDH